MSNLCTARDHHVGAFSNLKPDPKFFGGRLLHGRRKSRRPLSKKHPVHFVVRSTWARGPFSFLRRENVGVIERILTTQAKRLGIRIYQRSIGGNHIHLVARISSRENYVRFIRVVTGQIASHVMRYDSFERFVRSGDHVPSKMDEEPQGIGQRFWQFRPFSRVMTWGREFRIVCGYVRQNTAEALGFITYKPRTSRYARWLRVVHGSIVVIIL